MFTGELFSILSHPRANRGFEHIWAKSPDRAGSVGESLGAHTRRVWNNLRLLHKRTPGLSSLCGMPRFWIRAALAVAVHDLGKCCEGFQAMLRERGEFAHRHEVLSAVFLPWLLGEDLESDLEWVAAAVQSHHRDLSEIHSSYRPGDPYLGTLDGLECLRPEMTQQFYETAQSLFREEIWPLVGEWELGIDQGLCERVEAVWIPADGIGELRRVVDAAVGLWSSLRRERYDSPKALAGRFMRGILMMADHAGSA